MGYEEDKLDLSLTIDILVQAKEDVVLSARSVGEEPDLVKLHALDLLIGASNEDRAEALRMDADSFAFIGGVLDDDNEFTDREALIAHYENCIRKGFAISEDNIYRNIGVTVEMFVNGAGLSTEDLHELADEIAREVDKLRDQLRKEEEEDEKQLKIDQLKDALQFVTDPFRLMVLRFEFRRTGQDELREAVQERIKQLAEEMEEISGFPGMEHLEEQERSNPRVASIT